MTTPDETTPQTPLPEQEPQPAPDPVQPAAATPEDEAAVEVLVVSEGDIRRRRRLLVILVVLLIALVGLVALAIRYVIAPAPLPDLLPAPVGANLAPHYVFSIYEVDKPVGIALAPDGKRLYVAESGGERLVKLLDQEGRLLSSFAPPLTTPPQRAPAYLETDARGRVYVTDRSQHAVVVFDADGIYLDTILSPSLTLSEYLSKHLGGLGPDVRFGYNIFSTNVAYQKPGEAEASLPAPDLFDWSPMGIHIDPFGRFFLTDVTTDSSALRVFSSEVVSATNWLEFGPENAVLGEFGKGAGQFIFPNSIAVDSRGRIFVSDSNNSRVAVYSNEAVFLFQFGRGTGEAALNLPRGLAIDQRDRLYVVDAVAQAVKVYDVSADEIEYLFSFGDLGMDDGQFNYPNDIAVDPNGRIYVVDRENNRVQVWMY